VSVSVTASRVVETFWTKSNADGVCQHVDALENARSALIRELDLFVRASG